MWSQMACTESSESSEIFLVTSTANKIILVVQMKIRDRKLIYPSLLIYPMKYRSFNGLEAGPAPNISSLLTPSPIM